MAITLSLLRDHTILAQESVERGNILKHIQYQFAKQFGLDTSLGVILSLFAPVKYEPSDKAHTMEVLKSKGYTPGGDWVDNQHFWKGIITKDQYDQARGESKARVAEGEDESKRITVQTISQAVRRTVGSTALSERVSHEIDYYVSRHLKEFDGSKPQYLMAHIELADAVMEEYYCDEEMSDYEEEEISADHYNAWLHHTLDIARERGLDPNEKYNFMDVLLDDVLDNDPLLDQMHMNTESAKGQIAKIVWRQYKAKQQQEKASAALKSKRGMEEEETAKQPPVQQVIADARRAAQRDSEIGFETNAQPTKNPYVSGTFRHKLWNDAYHHSFKSSTSDVEEEEEVEGGEQQKSIMDKIYKEGFSAALRAFNKAISDPSHEMELWGSRMERFECPHPKDTQACTMWNKGYKDALTEIIRREQMIKSMASHMP